MPTCFPTRSSRKVCELKRQLASFNAYARINSFSGLEIAFLTKLWSGRAASNFTLNARFHILINTTYAASAWQRISFCIFFCCTNPLPALFNQKKDEKMYKICCCQTQLLLNINWVWALSHHIGGLWGKIKDEKKKRLPQSWLQIDCNREPARIDPWHPHRSELFAEIV